MYADPAHTQAMSKSAVDVVLRKHEALREELTASGELTGGAGSPSRTKPRCCGWAPTGSLFGRDRW